MAYINEYNGDSLVATASAFLGLTLISVLLRIYVRVFMTNSFQMDDWFMVFAQVSLFFTMLDEVFILSCSFILLGVRDGMGRHNTALPQEAEIEALKWQALATATYVLDMMFIKLSIGIFLLRLAVQKVYKYILWGSLFVVTIWSTVIFFWDIFQCNPVAAQWDYTIPNSKCVTADQIVSAAYAISVMTILTDWLYALLPIPMLWNVDMTKQTKITVIVILGLGIFASVATLIRLKFLADLTDTADILFAGTDAMVWTLIEPGVAIVAASLATIRPLLRVMRLKGFETTRSGKSTNMQSGISNRSRHVPSMTSSPSRADRFGQADPINAPGLAVTTGEDARASFAPSETYVIEGERTQWRRGDSSRGSATPYSNDAASTSLSSVDIIGMNPASQHGPLGHSTNNR
ncbi:unnamed protein product [Parascedosporium putredinis]|uniref:Rhodopsin domain-containing protein n=1 Tax=Parascedosporium putredinis TaxID=1442378 RepID=A0A9P1GTV0_9PEZI|nr:unnamed protein product [Parascedosporium putredinis]CAI7987287.1 unnamed protein product [Parascedosporium putredinis]